MSSVVRARMLSPSQVSNALRSMERTMLLRWPLVNPYRLTWHNGSRCEGLLYAVTPSGNDSTSIRQSTGRSPDTSG